MLGSPAPSSPRPPVAGLIAAEEFPGPSVATGQDTIGYSLATGTGIYHAVGSAAMGPGDDDVVDARLRVRGVTGCGSPTPPCCRSR